MEKPIFVWLYKGDDKQIELDLEPLVYDEWPPASKAAPVNAQWLSIIQRSSSLLDGKAVAARTRKPFDETNTVMDIQLDNGRSALVRVLVPGRDDDPATQMWKRARLFSEFSILCWLETNAPDLPVPRVLAINDDDGVKDLLITTLMPGLDAAHTYPRLSPKAKEHSVISWAPISVLMFRLPVPQQFGLIKPLYKVTSHLSITPEYSFDISETTNLLSFFTSAISSRRAFSLRSNNEEHEILCKRLDRLLVGLEPLIARMQETPYMSRFALTHSDLRPSNIMLNEANGEVVGIVDWEYHGCMPACMSAEYPRWIRSPITESPIYRNPKSTIVSFFNDPKEERIRLSVLYENTVKGLDMEYYNCLIQGTRLRDALAWIENSTSDPDGFAMECWTEDHLFSNVTDADHRCLV
ncbi:hypothetical protein DFH09DRAFT_1208643 [Mycena vulgaris]|nr:hypothetical protein DFH09DRAFT_1208643 [Mycena vulgaris]